MVSKIIPVIMSGGSGTRLWPLSTPAAPKQFHALATPKSMIQETALRLTGDNFLKPVAICGKSHLDLVMTQLSEIDEAPQAVILEPFARNTAAVAAMAALSGEELDPDYGYAHYGTKPTTSSPGPTNFIESSLWRPKLPSHVSSLSALIRRIRKPASAILSAGRL